MVWWLASLVLTSKFFAARLKFLWYAVDKVSDMENQREELLNIISDFSKDATGSRQRANPNLPIAELEALADYWVAQAGEQIARERAARAAYKAQRKAERAECARLRAGAFVGPEPVSPLAGLSHFEMLRKL